MNRIYLATVLAIFVTVSLAINLLLVGTRGMATPGLPAKLKSALQRLRRHLRLLIDGMVATMLAGREREARIYAARKMAGVEQAGCRDLAAPQPGSAQ